MKQIIISIFAAILLSAFLSFPTMGAPGTDGVPNSVIVHDANLRSGPGTEFSIIRVLRKGTQIHRQHQQGQWVRMDVFSIDKTGWVHSSLLENIPSSAPAEIPQQAMIGVIDIPKVLNESKQGKAAKKRFELIHDDEHNQESESAEKQIISTVIIEIQAVVESYARRHGYTHILNKDSGSVFYHDALYDITNAIIKEYDQQVGGDS